MTVVVAVRTKNGVTMAADRQVSYGWSISYHEQPKIWVSGRWILGGSGCLRTMQVIKHFVTMPKYRPDEDSDWEAFVVKQVVPAIKTGLDGAGVIKTDSGVTTWESSLLIATGDRIAEISGNGAVVSETAGRHAIGCGYGEAYGRLGVDGPWTEADAVDAVRRASQVSAGVSGAIAVADTSTLTVREVTP